MTHPERLTHLYNLCLEARTLKDSKRALSGLHIPSVRDTHSRVFPPTDVRITVMIKPLNPGPEIVLDIPIRANSAKAADLAPAQ
jgi:hypothetical protein